MSRLLLGSVLLAILGWRGARTQSMDQLIQSAMTTSTAGDFMQDSNNVLVELDMLFLVDDWVRIQAANDADDTISRVPELEGEQKRKKRKAIRQANKRWTNKVIPYVIAGGTFNSHALAQINAAIADWERYTCLDFRRRRSERNYISIQNGGGCSSYVGMIGGSQPVSLASGCRQKGVIVHELGHAIGFQHEQTRPDRNRNVRINFQNIMRGTEFNFQQYSTSVVNDYGVPYDYTSVMHYGQYAFSANGRPTIQTLDPAKQNLIGNRHGHSFRDIKLANLMYSCGGHCGSKTCPGEGFVGKDCKCYCPGSPVQECGGGGGGGSGGGGGGGSGGECEDEHANCGTWAAQGECQSNPAYMLESCKVACKVCEDEDGGGEGGGCEDSKETCSIWSNQGYCTSGNYVNYMTTNCAKSCGHCDGGGGTGGSCTDSNTNCPYWASIGECTRNTAWMLPNCKKSCRQC